MRSRGYLPHYDAAGALQHVVFRLADSLPIAAGPGPDNKLERLDAALDAGHGARWLSRPDVAQAVAETLTFLDSERYALEAWCVMPTHVHVLLVQVEGHPLHAVVQGWKSVSAKRSNTILNRTGRFWAPDYFDRAIRSQRQYEAAFHYVEANPVRAGLCVSPEDWPWSSAARRRD